MTWFHLLQIVLWLAATTLSVRLVRGLCFDAALDVRPLNERLEQLLRIDPQRAEALLQAARPAWIAIVGLEQLRAVGPDAGRGAADTRVSDLRQRAMGGLGTLMTMGRIAPPLAFLGVILELTTAFGGGDGLEGLQKGLPEQLALARSVTGVCLGATTATCCFVTTRVLAAALRQLERDVLRTRSRIEDATLPLA